MTTALLKSDKGTSEPLEDASDESAYLLPRPRKAQQVSSFPYSTREEVKANYTGLTKGSDNLPHRHRTLTSLV